MEIIHSALAGLSKAVRALSPNCRESSRLQSEQFDRPLSFPQRVGLRIHLLLCRWCARYGRQLNFLRRAARVPREEAVSGRQATLSPVARERIRRAIHEHERRS